MKKTLFVLIESAAGYVIVRIKEWDVISSDHNQMATFANDYNKLKSVMKVIAVKEFDNSTIAFENMDLLSKATPPPLLLNLLRQCLPLHRSKFQLGVCDPALAKSLHKLKIPSIFNSEVVEISRGLRQHLRQILSKTVPVDLTKFQLGLGHVYSRQRIQFDPKRQDRPVMYMVSLVDELTKDINNMCMRVTEWYSWHFPELAVAVSNPSTYCQLVAKFPSREALIAANSDNLEKIVPDSDLANRVVQAANYSMGQDCLPADLEMIQRLASQTHNLMIVRESLLDHMNSLLDHVSPNLKELLGGLLAARLISTAGSLTNLAKLPASTVQLLGAEKALFRAIKARTNTPKYGLLFLSSFIGKSAPKRKGRVARTLASKCALAARIDLLSDVRNADWGKKFKAQMDSAL